MEEIMTLKKVKVFVLIFLLTLAFAASLHTPKETEAIWIVGYMIELYCDECRGQWRSCCEVECYKTYAENQHTDVVDMAAYENCVNDCAINLASYCGLY